MDLFTLIKANIRRRKGTFISIVILMFISSMALTLILSINKSSAESYGEAFRIADCPDIEILMRENNMTDSVRTSLDNSQSVKRYSVVPAVVSDYNKIGNYSTGNSWLLVRMKDNMRLVNSSCDGYEKEVPKLKKGEIYLTYGTKDKLRCNVGDTLICQTLSGEHSFTVRGFVDEPMLGASNIGWKMQFISDEDYEEYYAAGKAKNDADHNGTGYLVNIWKSDDCDLTSSQFAHKLSTESSIIAASWGSITKDESLHYTNIYSDIIMGIMLAFILILVVVVLIVAGHSISTSIEMDQVNLGILKAQGFTNGRIRVIFMIQYMLAEAIGALLGIIPAIPLIRVMTSMFDPISGYISVTKLALGKTLLYLLGVFILSALFIVFITRKIGRISPICAISGGRREIYFDSRLTAPISGGALSATLALRQFTSAKRRYIASIIIAAVLVFFMLMVNAIGDTVYSKNAIEMMGGEWHDMWITTNRSLTSEEIDKATDIIGEFTKVRHRYFYRGQYVTVNDDKIYCIINAFPEEYTVYEGRYPKYDNEIVITEIISDRLGIKIGDKVTIKKNDKTEEFIVSGYFNCMNDTGVAIGTGTEGGERLGLKRFYSWGGFNLEDTSRMPEIQKAMQDRLSSEIKVNIDDEGDTGMDLYDKAVLAMKIVIYSFSLVFALVVVSMVSSKAFSQEKTDIGIFKSQGFTSGKLRMQFAVRFVIVSILGAVIGSVMGIMFINDLLSVLLKGIGITNFHANFTFIGVLIPVGVICLCYFVFALFVSRKIKKVGIRQLVTE